MKKSKLRKLQMKEEERGEMWGKCNTEAYKGRQDFQPLANDAYSGFLPCTQYK